MSLSKYTARIYEDGEHKQTVVWHFDECENVQKIRNYLSAVVAESIDMLPGETEFKIKLSIER